MSPVSRSVLEQKAKEFHKLKSLKWSKALDEASRAFGFSNYRHYLNESKKNLAPSVEIRSNAKASNLSELILNLNNSSSEEIRSSCIQLDLSSHVKNYLQSLFDKRFLTVSAFIPNELQKLSFDYNDFNYEIQDKQIQIQGLALVSVLKPSGELFEYLGSMKTSNQFDLSFNVALDSFSNLSLIKADLKGRAF